LACLGKQNEHAFVWAEGTLRTQVLIDGFAKSRIIAKNGLTSRVKKDPPIVLYALPLQAV
jgi:hypothetical protein